MVKVFEAAALIAAIEITSVVIPMLFWFVKDARELERNQKEWDEVEQQLKTDGATCDAILKAYIEYCESLENNGCAANYPRCNCRWE